MARFRILPLLLAALLLLGGCSASPDPSDAQEPEETKLEEEGPVLKEELYRDRLARVGIAWQEAAGIHPFISTSVPNQAVMSLVYEGLFQVDSSFTARPVLCERCTASADNTYWTFTLREGVRFSDGSALTARDAVASIEAARASDSYQSRFRNIAKLTAEDDRTLSVQLVTSYENLPLVLDVPIVKADTLETDVPLGSGPYYPISTFLVPNDYWWGGDAAVEKDRIRLVAVENTERARDEFQFGEVDLVYSDPTSSDSADYHCDYELWSCPTTVMLYLGFKTNGTYFSSRNLRCAVTHLLDRNSLIADYYGGFGLSATLPCSPLCAWYDGALASEYEYDEALFDELLRTSGVSPDPANPVKLLVTNNSNRRIALAEKIAQLLTDHGVRTVVETYDTLNFRYKLAVGEFDLYLSEIRLAPNFDLGCFFMSYGSASFGGIDSDTLLQRNARALENSGNYYDLYRLILRDGLLCPIMFKVNALYASRGLLGSHAPSVQWALETVSDRTVYDVLNLPEDADLPAALPPEA